MNEVFYNDKRFEDEVHDGKTITGVEFYKCHFYKCSFKETKFSECSFEQCVFEECDLSLMKINKTTFSSVQVKSSKAIGVIWSDVINAFAIDFTQSNINYGNFVGKQLKKVKFINCSIAEADFSDCNLSQAVFTGSDLTNARFIQSDLTQANFIDATNYTIDVNINKIKKAKFKLPEALSLLYSLDIIVEE
ncbi:MAG: pentapeptide repeat-containing protein [Filimonas sp.]|nr:pentapeptide repeat-containing protein [Filimonas sp.]